VGVRRRVRREYTLLYWFLLVDSVVSMLVSQALNKVKSYVNWTPPWLHVELLCI
jgi:hypothetical protein